MPYKKLSKKIRVIIRYKKRPDNPIRPWGPAILDGSTQVSLDLGETLMILSPKGFQLLGAGYSAGQYRPHSSLFFFLVKFCIGQVSVFCIFERECRGRCYRGS